MTSRPWGVTVLSVLSFLNSAAYLVLAVLSIVNRNALAATLQALSPGGAGPQAMHMSMGRFVTVYYAVLALVTGTLATGFWKLWNWTRMVVLGLIGVSFIGAAVETFGAVRSGAAGAVFFARVGVSVLISVLIGWYLLSAKVRAAFRPSTTGRQSGPPNGSPHHAG